MLSGVRASIAVEGGLRQDLTKKTMNVSKRDAPGVFTIPPLIYVPFLAMGIVLDYLFPVPLLPNRIQYLVGFAVIAVSGLIMPFVLLEFRKFRTNFNPRKATTTIITTGPYRFSRNPSYLALTLIYISVGIAADSIWILGLLIPALALMHYGVITREERYLEKKFGEEYLCYKRSVRRWL